VKHNVHSSFDALSVAIEKTDLLSQIIEFSSGIQFIGSANQIVFCGRRYPRASKEDDDGLEATTTPPS
jgi:hypothetical protein